MNSSPPVPTSGQNKILNFFTNDVIMTTRGQFRVFSAEFSYEVCYILYVSLGLEAVECMFSPLSEQKESKVVKHYKL